MNITQILLLVIAILTGWTQHSSAAVTKINLADADQRHFLFIENQEDHNLFITPTDYLDPRLSGGNAWSSDARQVSLAYTDNGHNIAVTNYNIDMWENSPIYHPYINQRCIKSWAGCDPIKSEAVNKPAIVNETGFFGLMKAATGYAHARLSSSFFDYLRNMPTGTVLNREMNLCMTIRVYNAVAGERCIDQDIGTWYVKKIKHKKSGHLRFIQTNAISEVIVDSNGVPYVLPGSQGCENYRLGTRDGVLCRFLDYDFNQDGSQLFSDPYIYTNIKNAALNSAIVGGDVQMSTNLTNWALKGADYNVSYLRGQSSIYLFLSSNFFKQVVRLGLQEQLTRNMINFNMRNIKAPESGFYEFSGTTEIIIKPREFSVSIISSEGVSNPYKEGNVGKDVLRFSYAISDSGPKSADILEIAISQDIGSPYQGFCTFYPVGEALSKRAVPIPSRLIFDTTDNGAAYRHAIRCDRTPVDIRELGIADSQQPQEWNDPVSGKGISRFYKLALEFDLTDPMVQRTVGNEHWEGEVQQSGTITIKGTWR
jgi:Mat/Ecp fimbriae adhesin